MNWNGMREVTIPKPSRTKIETEYECKILFYWNEPVFLSHWISRKYWKQKFKKNKLLEYENELIFFM